MKVKEFMAILESCDPDGDVAVVYMDAMEGCRVVITDYAVSHNIPSEGGIELISG